MSKLEQIRYELDVVKRGLENKGIGNAALNDLIILIEKLESATPTQWAYEQVCKANEDKRVKIEGLEKAYELAVRAIDKLKEKLQVAEEEIQAYVERDAGENI